MESRFRPAQMILPACLACILLLALVLDPVVRDGRVDLSLFGFRLPPTCWFLRLTGLPCAGCGLTRSMVLLVHGRLAESLVLHPFALVFAALGLLQLPPRFAAASGRRGGWISRWDRAWLVAGLIVLGVMVAWWAWRILPILVGGPL